MIIRTAKTRSQRGALFQTLLPMLFITCFAVAAFAVDFAHGILLRAQLQNACDAAALSAAQDFMSIQPAPVTQQQIAKAQNDAAAIAKDNVADGESITINPIQVTYNQNPSATVPVYSVTVTAQQNLNTFFAVIFGHTFAPLTASSNAGIFNMSRIRFAKMTDVNVPLAVTIDVDANNAHDTCPASALQNVKQGAGFQIQASGTTGSGNVPGTNAPANAAWVSLSSDDTTATPLPPTSGAPSPATQWASQQNPGIAVGTDGSVYSTLSSGSSGGSSGGSGGSTGSTASGAGSNAWTTYVGKQVLSIVSSALGRGPRGMAGTMTAPGLANNHGGGGSVSGGTGSGSSSGEPVIVTVPLVADPSGDSDPSSLTPGHQLKVIGTVSFSIISTSLVTAVPPMGPDSMYGNLVNAQPIDANAYGAYSQFFDQFSIADGTNAGTQTIRLYN